MSQHSQHNQLKLLHCYPMALQNPNIRKATYRLPDGTIISRMSQHNQLKLLHCYPMLFRILTFEKASYRLPDGTLVSTSADEAVDTQIPHHTWEVLYRILTYVKHPINYLMALSFLETNQNSHPLHFFQVLFWIQTFVNLPTDFLMEPFWLRAWTRTREIKFPLICQVHYKMLVRPTIAYLVPLACLEIQNKNKLPPQCCPVPFRTKPS